MLTHLKTVHFWLTFIAVSIGGSIETGWIPATGQAHTIAILAMMLLSTLGVHQAARWAPPSSNPTPPSSSPPSGAALAMLLFIAPTLTGCSYCLQSAHKSEPKCIAQQVGINCGEPAVVKVVEQILPQVVLALVNDDWSHLLDNLVATLEQQGVQDALGAVTCAVASTNQNITSITGGARAAALNPALIQAVHDHAVAWLELHRAVASR